MTQRISFRVHGQVQGVNFRSFTQRKANSYNLRGWVRNTDNGKVEGEAQGADDALRKLLQDLGNGPSAARVVKVEKQEIATVEDGEEGFEIR